MVHEPRCGTRKTQSAHADPRRGCRYKALADIEWGFGSLRRRYKKVAVLFGLATLTVALAAAWYLRPSPDGTAESPPPVIVSPPVKTGEVEEPSRPKTEKPFLKTVPRRKPPPFLVLNDRERIELTNAFQFAMGVALALSALLAGLLWWARRVVFENAGPGDAGDQIHYKIAAENLDRALMPGFNAALARLRFAVTGRKKIAWPESVAALGRAGGYPRLAFTDRRRQIDFVVMIDSRHLRDQAAWLMRRFSETLRMTNGTAASAPAPAAT